MLKKQNDQHKIELDENKGILTEVNDQMNDLLQTIDMKEGQNQKNLAQIQKLKFQINDTEKKLNEMDLKMKEAQMKIQNKNNTEMNKLKQQNTDLKKDNDETKTRNEFLEKKLSEALKSKMSLS